MNQEDIDVLISLGVDLYNNPNVSNPKIVRASLFIACFICINHRVKLEKLIDILTEVFSKIKIAYGVESMFDVGES
tara:strand:+ start:7446 stop:7673 length:228 start_codon:yes stop_codon:yes gene_type:complete